MRALSRGLRAIGTTRGISMMEVIVVLAVVGVLAATLTPMVLNYFEDSKIQRAISDVKTLGGVIVNLTRDVAHFPLYTDGIRTTGTPTIELLQGPGNDPQDHTDATKRWLTPALKFPLENHLIKNCPAGATVDATGNDCGTKYPSTGRFHWKGPYLEKITEDPWGNRYLVNIKNADPADPSPKTVYVISCGPNGKCETDPNAAYDAGTTAVGDDIAIKIK